MSAYTRFFSPLALQAASQGLTYPLREIGGPLNLAGLAQSNTLVYLLGTLGFGLITAGWCLAGHWRGIDSFGP